MDDLEQRPHAEQVSYWWGRICLAIGRGDVRNELSNLIVYYQREAFERGVKLGMQNKHEARRKANPSVG